MPVANLREKSTDRTVSDQFLKKLKARDPDLDLAWHPGCQRFVMTRWIDQEVRTIGGLITGETERVPIHVLTLRWPDGSFRDYGDWIFQWLNDCDLFRVDMETLFRHQDEFEAKKRERSIQASGERMESWVKDNRISFNNWWSRRQRGLYGKVV